jgi:hypothetical protein
VNEILQRDTNGSTNLAQLDQIKSAFTGFVFGDEGLRLVQSFGKIVLTQPGSQPQLPQCALQGFLLSAENAFFHLRI